MKTLFFMFVNMCYSIDCWHCDAKSPMECVLYGSSRTCPGRDVSTKNILWVLSPSLGHLLCGTKAAKRKTSSRSTRMSAE